MAGCIASAVISAFRRSNMGRRELAAARAICHSLADLSLALILIFLIHFSLKHQRNLILSILHFHKLQYYRVTGNYSSQKHYQAA